MVIESLFNYLKRIFVWADETPRKRRASNDLSEIYCTAPKKQCSHQYNTNSPINYIDIEDDGAVEIISEYISPMVRRKMNGYNSTPKSKPPVTNSRRSRNYCEPNSFQSISSRNIRIPTTLYNANVILDRKKYGDMLQNFMSDKDRQPHILCRESEKEPVQEVEIIELDKTEEPKIISRRNSNLSKIPTRVTTKVSSNTREPITVVHLDNDLITLPGTSKKSQSKSPIEEKPILVNSFREKYGNNKVLQNDYTSGLRKKYDCRQEILRKRMEIQEKEAKAIAKQNQLNRDAKLSENLARSMRLTEPFLDEREEPEEPELPKLTQQMLQEINIAWSARSPDEILSNNFGLSIKRRDIHTLADLNWLNDEVINFYMNLLIERGKSDKFPNVHAMNTFFYPKLMQSGHQSLRRWTRKVDIFSQDLIVVPIHLGIHWCMSIIDFRDKSIRYFDSMGGNNTKCLAVLRQYLEDESLDKKNKPYDTSKWKLECVKKIPQQMNGSDCGVFSCMFAEYITANKQITFTQNDMPYFRCKMVYEILHSKLL